MQRNITPNIRIGDWFDPNYSNTPFGELYGQEFGLSSERTTAEINSILKLVNKFPNPVTIVDLACGPGRIGEKLLGKSNINKVIGVDINQNFLKKAEGLGLQVVESDIRQVSLTSNLAEIVLLMFTSFGYFEDISDDIRVLKEAKRILTPNGVFLIDLPNYDNILNHFIPNREFLMDDGEVIRYKKEIVGEYLFETRTLIRPSGEETQLAPLRLRIYQSKTIERLCCNVFPKVRILNEQMNAFDVSKSRRMWVLCYKNTRK